MNVYSVYDRVCEKYAPPFIHDTDASAIRAFRESLKGNPYPQDFQLVRLGSWNETEGMPITTTHVPRVVYEMPLNSVSTNEPNSKQAADSPTAPECTKGLTENVSGHNMSVAEAQHIPTKKED